MTSFRELVMELRSTFEMPEPVFTERSASIAFDDVDLTINDIGNGLNFSAIVGAMPTKSPTREEVTQKLLQGSLSILRTHSILIHIINKKGESLIATDYKMSGNEANINNIKSNFDDFRAVIAAIKEIITGPQYDNTHHQMPDIHSDSADDIEFVFRA